MRLVLQIVSWLSLVVLVLPSILYLAGRMELDTAKTCMIVASVIWFVAATPWMWRSSGPVTVDEETVI